MDLEIVNICLVFTTVGHGRIVLELRTISIWKVLNGTKLNIKCRNKDELIILSTCVLDDNVQFLEMRAM